MERKNMYVVMKHADIDSALSDSDKLFPCTIPISIFQIITLLNSSSINWVSRKNQNFS